MSELSRLVNHCSLMDVSQLEQDLACNDEHSAQVSAMAADFYECPSQCGPPTPPPLGIERFFMVPYMVGYMVPHMAS